MYYTHIFITIFCSFKVYEGCKLYCINVKTGKICWFNMLKNTKFDLYCIWARSIKYYYSRPDTAQKRVVVECVYDRYLICIFLKKGIRIE